ncbi:MAG: hypothetical protein A3H97_25190 [Acidobacteria bacterium RIFCSPLOWO2_02_FULL_65_29]|nr:MAG: hypothetical protein A3H97_25190 [Acidobacteria bacterium RIFCSPLOWO2_02_FULL_65_29]
MTHTRIVTAFGLATVLLLAPPLADAQSRNRGATGRAVPRTGPPPRPSGGGGRTTSARPYYARPYYSRPYYYYGPFSPGYGVGLYSGYGYPGYYGPYAYARPYGYPAYGYSGYGYGGYAYGSGYGRAYGGVRIDLPQRDAEVLADGYFVGTVDNFDGALQQLNLEPGAHRIDIRQPGFEPVSFEVYVEPGRTITYRTALRPAQP